MCSLIEGEWLKDYVQRIKSVNLKKLANQSNENVEKNLAKRKSEKDIDEEMK